MWGTEGAAGRGEDAALASSSERAHEPQSTERDRSACDATKGLSTLPAAGGGPTWRCAGNCPAVEVIAQEVQSAARLAGPRRPGRLEESAVSANEPSRRQEGWKPCHGVLDAACRDEALARRAAGVLVHQLEQDRVERDVVCAFAEVCSCLERQHATVALYALLGGLRRGHGQGRVQEEIYHDVLDRAFGVVSLPSEERQAHWWAETAGIPEASFLRFLAGELDALAHIVECAKGRLLGYSQRRWPRYRMMDAEDLVQETFLGVAKCMLGGGGPMPNTPVDLWHYLVATLNNCVRRSGGRARVVHVRDPVELAELVAGTPAEAVWSDFAVVLDAWSMECPQVPGRWLAQHLTGLVRLALELQRVPQAGEIEERLRVSAPTASRLRWDLVQALRAEMARSER